MKYVYAALAGLVLAAGAFYAGYSYHKPAAKIETQVKEVEKVVTKTVRETVTAPGGKKIVTETVTSTKDLQATRAEAKPMAAKARQVNYSLGLVWHPTTLQDFTPAGVEVGYRVLGDVWGTATWDWQDKAALIGIKLQF